MGKSTKDKEDPSVMTVSITVFGYLVYNLQDT